MYLSIGLSVCLTATRTKQKKTKKRTWTTTIATACRFVPGNTEARNLIKLETRSDGRKEGMNRETKAPKKKLGTQFSFFSRLWDRSQIYISKGNQKKAWKETVYPTTSNAHKTRTRPKSILSLPTQQQQKHSRRKYAGGRDGARKEREKKRQTPGDEMPAVISPAGHGLPSQWINQLGGGGGGGGGSNFLFIIKFPK